MKFHDRFRNRVLYLVELLVVWSPLSRLVLVALLLGSVALGAGLLAYRVTASFPSLGAALWWAFLRLTDPGYLGDDEGLFLRAVATVVTVTGYVLFVGALVAIMTQWLNVTLARLERGLTPVVRRNHVVVLGWSLRTAVVVKNLLTAEERVRRFLDRVGAGRLHVVVLAEETASAPVQRLKEHLGPRWNPRRVTVRCGSPLTWAHLLRVDFFNAAAVLLPGSDVRAGRLSEEDEATIKVLLSASRNHQRYGSGSLPLMAAEINDARLVGLARGVYRGPIEVVCSQVVLSRLVTQCLRQPGLSAVLNEVLSHQAGSEIHVRQLPQLAGKTVGEVWPAFDRGVFLGLVRPEGDRFRSWLAPPLTTVVEPQDRCVVLTTSFDGAHPKWPPAPLAAASAELERAGRRSPPTSRLLIVGWNEWAPALLTELARYGAERFTVTVLARNPAQERWALLERLGGLPEGFTVEMHEGDAASPSELGRLAPARFDQVVLLASDVLETERESDARTILAYLVLKDLVGEAAANGPRVVVTLHDPQSAGLFSVGDDDFLVTPLLLSHVLTQVALRRELGAVFEELLGPGGAEFSFSSVALAGEKTCTFRELQNALWHEGRIALGVRQGSAAAPHEPQVSLNPAGRQRFHLTAPDQLVVLMPGGEAEEFPEAT